MGKEPTNGDWAAAVQELGEVAAEGLAGEAMICVGLTWLLQRLASTPARAQYVVVDRLGTSSRDVGCGLDDGGGELGAASDVSVSGDEMRGGLAVASGCGDGADDSPRKVLSRECFLFR